MITWKRRQHGVHGMRGELRLFVITDSPHVPGASSLRSTLPGFGKPRPYSCDQAAKKAAREFLAAFLAALGAELTPAPAAPGEPPVVLATPHELIGAASGHTYRCIAPQVPGGSVMLRIPTLAEYRQGLAAGDLWHAERGLPCPEAPTDPEIMRVISPLPL